jgi:hypothetical protein
MIKAIAPNDVSRTEHPMAVVSIVGKAKAEPGP